MSDFLRMLMRKRPLPPNRRSVVPLMTLALALAILSSPEALQQAVGQASFSGQPNSEQLQQLRALRGRKRGSRSLASPPAETKQEEKQPAGKEDKKEEEAEKKQEEVKTIKRPTDGSGKLDPNRVRLQPDANGLVQFNYSGHPWAEVLQEFADAAKFSFDWQELPADNLNLVTQKKYNLLQARDLLNRHLLARGFTLVVQGEVLTAVKISNLDPSLVPRVEADELEDYSPHDFVRVRFALPQSMEPAKAKDDVRVLLSPNAKVTPLLNSKRLLVIDTVANLRGVRDLLYAEQMAADSVIKPAVYHIRHRQANYVADQVMIVVGLDPSARTSPQELQLETQRMQLFMQMQEKGKDVSKLLKQEGPPVHIAVDRQQNTLLINAPSELMKMIDLTIKNCDVPAGAELASNVGGRSTKPHKTTTASTDAVVSALTEFGQLDPLTRLQSDAKTKTIFAYATEADHQKIEQMITKIDSTGREMHVIPLRRYSARQVAGTLTSMFGTEEKKKETNPRRRYFFYGMNEEEKKKELGFKAMPDVENNRLILWANAEELANVHKMLERLGESPDGHDQSASKVRELRGRSPEEIARLLERLKASYPGQLNITNPTSQPAVEPPQPELKTEDKVTQQSRRRSQLQPQLQRRLGWSRSSVGVRRSVGLQLIATGESNEPAEAAPPINVVVTEDGRIVISSDDPAALDQLEDVLRVIEPPRKEFDKFKLEHVYASNVVLKLEEYFAEELKGQTESVFDEWGEYQGKKEKQLGPATLGKRDLLRFVSDRYTNTVIVQGASASQLAVIKQLIAIYDEAPEPKDYFSRKTDVIELKYSRAQDIAKSLKEVYRELLSSKDKEFADKEGSSSFISDERTYVFGQASIGEDGKATPVLINFDGMLAIGVDEISNALIISARREVLESVKETVELLDQAATPKTTIHVHRVGGTLSAAKMQKTLKSSLGEPWPGGKPQQPAAQQGGGGNDREQSRDSAGDRRRRRSSR